MNKIQAYQSFWTNFFLPVYDENYVPENAQMPYITYESAFDSFGSDIALTVSLWYRGMSWADASQKALQISEYIGRGGALVPYDDGAFWIRRGQPFAQRMGGSNDDMVKRIVLNVVVEFID